MLTLKSPLADVIRTTAAHKKKLLEMGLHTVQDLLLYYPRTVQLTEMVGAWAELQVGVRQTFIGPIGNIKKTRTSNGRELIRGSITLPDGHALSIVWFRVPYQLRSVREGQTVTLIGQIKRQYGKWRCKTPRFTCSKAHTRRIFAWCTPSRRR